jgi:YD repeat-containing protein
MTKAETLGVTDFPYCEYDDKRRITYYENALNEWSKTTFMPGNKIYVEFWNESWTERILDDRGHEIYSENSHKCWYKYERDDEGKCLKYTDHCGQCTIYEYDDDGRLISWINNYFGWVNYMYDEYDNVIAYNNSKKDFYITTFDEDNFITSYKNKDHIAILTYDNNVISQYEDSNGNYWDKTFKTPFPYQDLIQEWYNNINLKKKIKR